ncbi:MAG: Cof-type HAD-IIB family hydrolase [Bacillota bacterium]|nr:Cof-type HAD-IIB family hydrolase [Bacillota bacterium]
MSAIFFDLEGTLLDKKHRLPPSAVEAVNRLRKEGHLVFVNTGFGRAEIRPEILDIGIDGIIAANGTSVHVGEKRILEETIPQSVLEEILPRFEERKIDLWLSGPEYVYVADLQAEGFMAEVIAYLNMGRDIVRSWHDSQPVANQATYHCSEEGQIEPLLPLLNKHFVVVPHRLAVGELALQGFNKGTGMELILKHLNREEEETYAFGDSLNDLSMFERATHGIAMEGGAPALLKKAEYITASPEEDGIERALRHYNLLS